jgi:hypothetical protein
VDYPFANESISLKAYFCSDRGVLCFDINIVRFSVHRAMDSTILMIFSDKFPLNACPMTLVHVAREPVIAQSIFTDD